MDAENNGILDRYYDLLRLQRRVNKVLEEQSAAIDSHAQETLAALQREAGKVVKADADPNVLQAIVRAAAGVSESDEFTKLSREAAARVRLQALTSRYGAPDAFRKTLSDMQKDIEAKEAQLAKLNETVEWLDKRLQPIYTHNDRKSFRITQSNREKIEQAGFFARANDPNLAEACQVYKEYANQYGRRSGDVFYGANCLDDMNQLARDRETIKGLTPEIDFLKDKYFRLLGAYKDTRDSQAALRDLGVKDGAVFSIETYQAAFLRRLQDPAFLAAFTRELAPGIAGPVVLAAVQVAAAQKIRESFAGCKGQIAETTKLLEGPIGSIAKAMQENGPIDGIERDIMAQAVMAGYLCAASASAIAGLQSFSAGHAEGPASIARDMQIHMIVNGKVDPAYIHEIWGMDGTLTKLFNVNAIRPRPDFKAVLEDTEAIERIDRHYAAFLREHAEDKEINDAGFAAGQFDTISFEVFLGRYFAAGSTMADITKELEKKAGVIENTRNERRKMGINPDGPNLP